MFIFDFVAETILDQILDWIYGKIIGFLNDFFVMMNNMGVELFELPWVNAVTTFFSYLGWALFGVGLVVGAFECAIEYQGGRGSIKDTAMNAFLTIQVEDTTIMDFIRYACAYFFMDQQQYEWRYTPDE